LESVQWLGLRRQCKPKSVCQVDSFKGCNGSPTRPRPWDRPPWISSFKRAAHRRGGAFNYVCRQPSHVPGRHGGGEKKVSGGRDSGAESVCKVEYSLYLLSPHNSPRTVERAGVEVHPEDGVRVPAAIRVNVSTLCACQLRRSRYTRDE
jgi:hypothetical protein